MHRNADSNPCVPKISVVIPAYRAARTIADAVRSALAQTYTGPTEIIVVNDGSPDAAEMEAALRPYRSQIRYIRQRNRGASLARNAGIMAAAGEWVAFLDADDYWYENSLESLLSVAVDAGSDMVYANADLVGPRFKAGTKYTDWAPSTGKVTTEALLAGRCSVLTSSVLVKRHVLLEAGMFDPTMDGAEDFDLWVRIALNGRSITYTEDALMCRRYTEESLSADRKTMISAARAACQKVLRRKDASPELRALAVRRIKELTQSYRNFAIRQSRVVRMFSSNVLYCYLRHQHVDGYCPECQRQWTAAPDRAMDRAA